MSIASKALGSIILAPSFAFGASLHTAPAPTIAPTPTFAAAIAEKPQAQLLHNPASPAPDATLHFHLPAPTIYVPTPTLA